MKFFSPEVYMDHSDLVSAIDVLPPAVLTATLRQFRSAYEELVTSASVLELIIEHRGDVKRAIAATWTELEEQTSPSFDYYQRLAMLERLERTIKHGTCPPKSFTPSNCEMPHLMEVAMDKMPAHVLASAIGPHLKCEQRYQSAYAAMTLLVIHKGDLDAALQGKEDYCDSNLALQQATLADVTAALHSIKASSLEG